jgi:hypothetical protein
LSELRFDIPKNYLYKNDAAILNIIAANKWKRPIYFTSPYGELGFAPYLRMDGLSYRLVPVAGSEVNKETIGKTMMEKFAFGGANLKGTYFDEENRRHLNSIRLAFAQAANSLADDKKEEAKKLLNKCDKMMLDANMPYGMASRSQQQNQFSLQMLMAAYRCGDTTLATKISDAVKKDMTEQAAYYESLPDNKREALGQEEGRNKQLMQGLLQMEAQFKNPPPPNKENGGVPLKTEGVK